MEQLQKDFFEFRSKMIETIRAKCDFYKNDMNPNLYRDYVKQYPFLKSKSSLPTLREILSWKETKERFTHETHMRPLLEHFISKITGIFKHGQTDKTRLCNERILTNVRLGLLSIAISKNTLNAKDQWEQRLLDSLKKEFPTNSLKKLILILSSKHEDLDGNATHCKDLDAAISHITRGNFKIIFVCSNKKRIEDILEILNCYTGLALEKRRFVDIQHDEAHNAEDGIPSKREYIETILLNPYVQSYVPVSASPDPIFDEKEPLWNRANMERNAIDYTKSSNVLSTSENYSSISDAHSLSFAQLMSHPSYKEYKITEFDEETFNEADNKNYTNWDPVNMKLDKDRRRQLEFHQFMAFEKNACNLGMNLLNNFYKYSYTEGDTFIETPIILSNIFNLHIITTPCRVALTIHLMKHAIEMEYNPICIGLYRSELHIRYRNKYKQTINKKFCQLDIETESKEMNSKIHEVLEYLKKEGESVERPILILGNYKPTGESITFVNYKYGTIRSDTLLPVLGQSREMNYQGFLRCAYMNTKFKEHSASFVNPPKWIIGSEGSINDALAYEKENDERVLRFSDTLHPPLLQPIVTPSEYPEDDNTNISVPCKITIQDTEDISYTTLRSLLLSDKRSTDYKNQIMNILRRMKESRSLEFEDYTDKFDFHTFKLKDVRTYKKHTEEDILKRREEKGEKYTPFEADYRFRQYDSHNRIKKPYINNKTKILPNTCELLVAFDKYEYERFINNKTVIWLSYRFE